MKVLLDADVLIGALDAGDAHHEEVRRRFTRWRRAETTLLVGLLNLSEVLVAPSSNVEQLARAREALRALELRVYEPTEAIAVEAAKLRRRHPISLADAYLLATARTTKATIVSFDRKLLRAAETEDLEHDASW